MWGEELREKGGPMGMTGILERDRCYINQKTIYTCIKLSKGKVNKSSV